MFKPVHSVRLAPVSTAGLLVAVLLLTPLLAACGPTATPVVMVTEAPPTEPQVTVVTATFTPAPPTTTPIPSDTPDLVATQIAVEEAAHATMTAAAPTVTNTPTDTPTPIPVPTETFTPVPPTKAPTKAPVTKPKNTPTPVPATYAPPALLSPQPNANCYRGGGCQFVWSWGGNLKADEYFQVQLVGPGNERRGIHPPTKGFSFTSDDSVYKIVTDWCNVVYFCHIKWTVAIIKWDGVDPSKIGRTLIIAEPRDIIL